MSKLLQIFKPGTHTTMAGKAISFGESDLAATIGAYDPAKHEAPLVIGHPDATAPAYGWVKALSFAEGTMLAEPDQVDAAFAEMVNSGKFKKISASFYQPDAPGNPVPGVFYLRHVGFLGAQPPAVKGLKSASFSESEEGVIEFGDWADRVEAGLFRSLREWIISKFSREDADLALPGWHVSTVESEAAKPEPCCDEAAPSVSYAEKQTKEEAMDLAVQKAELDRQAADFAERDKALKTREAAGRHTDHISFAEVLVRDGKMLPALKEQAVAMLDFAAGLEGENTIEFGEGDGKKSQPLAESFKALLSCQPKIVEFGEHAKPEDDVTHVANFSAPPGYTVDAAGLELHTMALAYQQKNPGTDYMAAVKACQ